MALTPFTTNLKTLGSTITPPSFMKFCPVVPEICHGQVHGPRKERIRIIIIKIKIIIRNNKSPKLCLGDLNMSWLAQSPDFKCY
jgi:hypothetical protein